MCWTTRIAHTYKQIRTNDSAQIVNVPLKCLNDFKHFVSLKFQLNENYNIFMVRAEFYKFLNFSESAIRIKKALAI